MDKQQIINLKSMFDSIAKQTEDGTEYWCARDLQELLGYAQWRRFNDTIERAKIACENSEHAATDHFAIVGKMIEVGL